MNLLYDIFLVFNHLFISYSIIIHIIVIANTIVALFLLLYLVSSSDLIVCIAITLIGFLLQFLLIFGSSSYLFLIYVFIFYYHYLAVSISLTFIFVVVVFYSLPYSEITTQKIYFSPSTSFYVIPR